MADEPDGGCKLRLRVKHSLEMKPWIRGWGPECEVLAPMELRQEVAADMIAELQPDGGLGNAQWRIRLLRNLLVQ